MLNWTEFGVLMTLMDFQNNLFYMVVQTANSILEMKKKKCLCSDMNLKFDEIGCIR